MTPLVLLILTLGALAILIYLLRRSLPLDDFDDVDWLSDFPQGRR